jgi:hypothetical protein
MGGGYTSYDYSLDDTVTKKSVDAYNIDVGRSYQVEKATGVPPPKGKRLTTNAKLPLVVAVDVTGSMREWPRVIFKKLCVLYSECLISLPDELKEDFEISSCAIGDVYCDLLR